MSRLNLRWATETDFLVLEAKGFDVRGLRSPNTYACICEQNGKVVGGASGANLGETAQLYMAIAAPGRWDILYAMVEGLNNLAISLGCKRSIIQVPNDDAKQCTGVTTSASLVTYIKQATPTVKTADYGKDMAKAGAPAFTEVITEDLPKQAEDLAALLDGLHCTRMWA